MSEIAKVLERIHRNSQLSAYAHFGASERMSKLHFWFGIPAAIIAVGLASVLFVDLQEVVGDAVKWTAAALSLVAALLTTLQTFFNPKEGKSKHREIANSYLSINRRSELVLAGVTDGEIDMSELSARVGEINQEYDQVNTSAQDHPTNDADWARAKRKTGLVNE